MYLDYFKLKDYPFSQALNTKFYYDLQSHHEALNVLLVSLGMKDGIIKITGETGTGKSLLCKLLLEKLGKDYHPIYLPNPYLSYDELIQTISDDLNVVNSDFDHKTKLTKAILERLTEIRNSGKHIVLLFDEAQGISLENLESIRILSNLESENKKLLQVVLIGGLELDDKLNNPDLRHFTQRISFTYKLNPMRKDDVKGYVMHRLTAASDQINHVSISSKASNLLHRYTGGSPRLINLLCHKAMLLAFSQGNFELNSDFISQAANDTNIVKKKSIWGRAKLWIGLAIVAIVAVGILLTLHFTL